MKKPKYKSPFNPIENSCILCEQNIPITEYKYVKVIHEGEEKLLELPQKAYEKLHLLTKQNMNEPVKISVVRDTKGFFKFQMNHD